MKAIIRYDEIQNIIRELYSKVVTLKTIDNKTVEIGYKPHRFISMSLSVHIDTIESDAIHLSYDCSSAMSMIISGTVAIVEQRIPEGIVVDASKKQICVYPQQIDKIRKALDYLSLADISFTEDAMEACLSVRQRN